MITDINNDPWPRANLFRWTRRTVWYYPEAAALLLGREPQAGSDIDSEYRTTEIAKARRGSADEDRYWDLVDVLATAVDAGELSNPGKPSDVLAWADRYRIIYPDELREVLDFARSGAVGDRADSEQLSNRVAELQDEIAGLKRELAVAGEADRPQSAQTKRMKSLLLIVGAIARDRYRYRPADLKSSAPANIVAAVERCGQSITDDTVRRILREADQAHDWTDSES
jgi:hypothetical protein